MPRRGYGRVASANARRDDHRHPHVPALRGDLRARADAGGRPDRQGPRGLGRRLQQGLHLPQGRVDRRAAPRPRPVARAAAAPARRGFRRGVVGRGVHVHRRALSRHRGRARPPGARRVHRQPGRAFARRTALRARAAEGARHAQRLLGEHRRPVPQAALGGAHVRDGAERPGSRSGPHDAPAGPRRRPARLQRLADDLAGRPRAPARHPRPRRQARGRGSAPLAHGA